MKDDIQKKIEYISEKYIKNSFLMCFKNQIGHKAAVVGNIAEDVPGSSS